MARKPRAELGSDARAQARNMEGKTPFTTRSLAAAPLPLQLVKSHARSVNSGLNTPSSPAPINLVGLLVQPQEVGEPRISSEPAAASEAQSCRHAAEMRSPSHAGEPRPEQEEAGDVNGEGDVGDLEHRERQPRHGEEHVEAVLGLEKGVGGDDAHQHPARAQDGVRRVREDVAQRRARPGRCEEHAEFAGRERSCGDAPEHGQAVGVDREVDGAVVRDRAGERGVDPPTPQVVPAAQRVAVESPGEPGGRAAPPGELPQCEDCAIRADHREQCGPPGRRIGRRARRTGAFGAMPLH
eukprot:CAMPEP_0176190108 /NCGR_PEP_ID=MMETSP0121_2-20121125/3770_1 /TAXON_ID=160619 /ORGANISM="Kryptoperidinium foliaceum, Strain CCMP 1326" /LENGTH=296 /DNA_ID=CAMNT_0017528723 /DNA_START=19 /DNA_END=907 /DNA_ORIENTATION=+